MIQTIRIKGRACPVVICDHCETQIVDAADASVLWTESLLGAISDPVFAHQRCDEELRKTCNEPGKSWSTSNLNTWFLHVARGIAWNANDAAANADIDHEN